MCSLITLLPKCHIVNFNIPSRLDEVWLLTVEAAGRGQGSHQALIQGCQVGNTGLRLELPGKKWQ